MRALLDTHVLLRWLEGTGGLSAAQRRVIRSGSPDEPLLVSDITLWEVATLNELGRISLSLPLRDWLEQATAPPLVQRCGITPAVAAEVAGLGTRLHRDPADRIIVATALVHGVTLLTSDQRIISAKIVPTIE